MAHGLEYFGSVENYLQLAIIGTTITFIIAGHIDVRAATHASAWAILCTWIDFTFQLGRLNDLGEYLFIVLEVGKKCLKFLLLYLAMGLAFALGFNILMHQVTDYSGIGSSSLRVFVQMVGEMELSDLFQWNKVKEAGASQVSAQVMFVLCTILFTIVIANLLIAMTIEASEKLKTEGDLIQSRYKHADIVSLTRSKLMKLLKFCQKDQSELTKIGMQWREYLLSERPNHFFNWIYAWLIQGGTVRLYNLEIPNARVATKHFIEAKFIVALKEALKRKERKIQDFNEALQEIKKKQEKKSIENVESLVIGTNALVKQMSKKIENHV